MSQAVSEDLYDAELVLHGRIRTASNATFLGSIGEVAVVYKPIAGERPLWDFPEGRLADREIASYLVSEATGWGVVPETWLREGPHGEGMVQRWCEIDEQQEAVTLVPEGTPLDGCRHVLDGEDAAGRGVSLVHEDSVALRRIAVFDAMVNNADRKGGHILEMADGHRFGIDHGLTFHTDPKLRTVLWGWQGEPLTDEELETVRAVRRRLDGDLGETLGPLLAYWELEALAGRCDELLASGHMPVPRGDWHVIPWPPF